MKKLIIFIVLLLILSQNHIIASPDFEFFGVDLKGIASAGNTIMIYGEKGVIVYSTDSGLNWKQKCLGWQNDILKITSTGDKFYALATNKVFVSYDNGNSWLETPIHWENNFVDFCTDSDKLFIVTENEILSADTNFNAKIELLYKFDSFISFSEIAKLGHFLFIIDSRVAIVKFNTITKTPEETIFTGFSQPNLEKIKIIDSTIYVLLNSQEKAPSYEFEFQFVRHKIAYSKDFGKSWHIFAKEIPVTKDYLVQGNNAYTLSPKVYDNNYVSISFVRSDSLGISEENDFREPNAWIPFFSGINKSSTFNTFKINAIARVSASTLVACGSNKTILLSSDNGKNWKFISYFRPFADHSFSIRTSKSHEFLWKGSDTIIVLSYARPFGFYSIDGGATFRTLASTTNLNKILPFIFAPMNHPNGNVGFITFNFRNGKPTDTVNIIRLDCFTNAFSIDTIILKPNKVFNLDSVEVIFPRAPFYFKGKIYAIAYYYFRYYNRQGSKPVIFVLDRDLKLVDTLFFPNFVNIPFVDEEYIYSTASDSNFIYILRSDSLKKGWELVDTVPLVDYKISYNVYSSTNLLGKVGNTFIFARNIYDRSTTKYNLVTFNQTTKKVDSIEISSYFYFFNNGNSIYLFTNSQLTEYPNLFEDTTLRYTYETPFDTKNSINNIFYNNGFYIISFRKPLSMDDHESNFAKIITSNGEPNLVIDKRSPYLFCYSPYPNPSTMNVNLLLFWDPDCTFEDVKISLYDFNGRKLDASYTLQQIDTFAGIVRFDCSNLPNGVYIVSVKLQNSVWSVPFVVSK